jgi:hypothetical protein
VQGFSDWFLYLTCTKAIPLGFADKSSDGSPSKQKARPELKLVGPKNHQQSCPPEQRQPEVFSLACGSIISSAPEMVT